MILYFVTFICDYKEKGDGIGELIVKCGFQVISSSVYDFPVRHKALFLDHGFERSLSFVALSSLSGKMLRRCEP